MYIYVLQHYVSPIECVFFVYNTLFAADVHVHMTSGNFT